MRRNTRFLLCFFIVGLFLSFSDIALYAQETAKEAKQTETNLISDKAKASTVRLVGLHIGGTGFFVAPDKIATNFHVAAGNTVGPIVAKLGQKETTWSVEGVMAFDIKSDIAILKVQGEGLPLPLADIETLQIGEAVFLAGYPNLEKYKVTKGIVQDIRSNDKQFHTTAEVYSGNSGSPVLNSKGEVIGIHYGHDPGNSPVNAIKTLLTNSTSTQPLEQWQKRNDIRAYVHFKQGKQKYYDGDSEGALENFNRAIELTPDDAEIYEFRAKLRVKLENYHAAIEDYNQVIKLNPDDASAYKERAEAKRKLGDHTSAIEDYNQAIKLNPKDAFAYKASADAKQESGDYTGAIEGYNQAIKLNPEDTEAYKERGRARAVLGDDAEAIEDYSQALKLNPKDVPTYTYRANIKRKLGDYTGAIEDYNQAITKLKDGSFTYTYQTENSLTTVTTTLDDSSISDIYKDRGWTKRALGDQAGAIEDFTQAIKLKPDDVVAYSLRGMSKSELGDHAGAIADYDKAIQLTPKSTNFYKKRGIAKAAFGDHAGAVEDFTHAIERKPDDPKAYQFRGHSKQALGQEEAAKIDFQRAKELESAQ